MLLQITLIHQLLYLLLTVHAASDLSYTSASPSPVDCTRCFRSVLSVSFSISCWLHTPLQITLIHQLLYLLLTVHATSDHSYTSGSLSLLTVHAASNHSYTSASLSPVDCTRCFKSLLYISFSISCWLHTPLQITPLMYIRSSLSLSLLTVHAADSYTSASLSLLNHFFSFPISCWLYTLLQITLIHQLPYLLLTVHAALNHFFTSASLSPVDSTRRFKSLLYISFPISCWLYTLLQITLIHQLLYLLLTVHAASDHSYTSASLSPVDCTRCFRSLLYISFSISCWLYTLLQITLIHQLPYLLLTVHAASDHSYTSASLSPVDCTRCFRSLLYISISFSISCWLYTLLQITLIHQLLYLLLTVHDCYRSLLYISFSISCWLYTPLQITLIHQLLYLLLTVHAASDHSNTSASLSPVDCTRRFRSLLYISFSISCWLYTLLQITLIHQLLYLLLTVHAASDHSYTSASLSPVDCTRRFRSLFYISFSISYWLHTLLQITLIHQLLHLLLTVQATSDHSYTSASLSPVDCTCCFRSLLYISFPISCWLYTLLQITLIHQLPYLLLNFRYTLLTSLLHHSYTSASLSPVDCTRCFKSLLYISFPTSASNLSPVDCTRCFKSLLYISFSISCWLYTPLQITLIHQLLYLLLTVHAASDHSNTSASLSPVDCTRCFKSLLYISFSISCWLYTPLQITLIHQLLHLLLTVHAASDHSQLLYLLSASLSSCWLYTLLQITHSSLYISFPHLLLTVHAASDHSYTSASLSPVDCTRRFKSHLNISFRSSPVECTRSDLLIHISLSPVDYTRCFRSVLYISFSISCWLYTLLSDHSYTSASLSPVDCTRCFRSLLYISFSISCWLYTLLQITLIHQLLYLLLTVHAASDHSYTSASLSPVDCTRCFRSLLYISFPISCWLYTLLQITLIHQLLLSPVDCTCCFKSLLYISFPISCWLYTLLQITLIHQLPYLLLTVHAIFRSLLYISFSIQQLLLTVHAASDHSYTSASLSPVDCTRCFKSLLYISFPISCWLYTLLQITLIHQLLYLLLTVHAASDHSYTSASLSPVDCTRCFRSLLLYSCWSAASDPLILLLTVHAASNHSYTSASLSPVDCFTLLHQPVSHAASSLLYISFPISCWLYTLLQAITLLYISFSISCWLYTLLQITLIHQLLYLLLTVHAVHSRLKSLLYISFPISCWL